MIFRPPEIGRPLADLVPVARFMTMEDARQFPICRDPTAGRASFSWFKPQRVFGISKPASRSMYLAMAVMSSAAAPLCIACLNTSRAAWHTHIGTPNSSPRATAKSTSFIRICISAIIEAAGQHAGREFVQCGTVAAAAGVDRREHHFGIEPGLGPHQECFGGRHQRDR